MFDRIDHVGIAVQSIEEKMPLYRDVLGLEFKGEEIVEDQGVRVAMFQIGESLLELLEPLGDEGPVATFLDEHGEGMHHLAVGCDDIEAARERAMERGGLTMLSDEPLEGANNKWISFVHPKDTGGVLLELTERRDEGEE